MSKYDPRSENLFAYVARQNPDTPRMAQKNHTVRSVLKWAGRR
jgi:hypothetical protein